MVTRSSILNRGTVYCGAVLFWILQGVLFPTWTGRLYNRSEDHSPSGWQSGGVFGLRGADGFYKRAPIWSPPTARGEAVRWPWQRPSQRRHVELVLATLFGRWSAGIIVLGFAYRLSDWIRPVEDQYRLLSIAWSVSLFLVIAWLCIFALAAFSMGYATTDRVVIGVISIGTLAGLAYGLGTTGRKSSVSGISPRDTDLTGKRNVRRAESSGPLRQIGAGLTWFTLGLIAALCITWAAGFTASFLRGPVVGVWELGTPRYARDQTAVNVIAGAGITVSGWLLSLVLVRRGPHRGLALGLVVATTVLGVLFALWR